MQNISLIYGTNPFEKLFIEKGIELLYSNTIDTYRLRLHNPKTLIEELITVAAESVSGILTNNDYVVYTCKELKKIIDNENHGLNFTNLNKKYYSETISKFDKSNYKLLIQSSKIVLRDNEQYERYLLHSLYKLVYSHKFLNDDGTSRFRNDVNDLQKKLIVLSNHLLVALIHKGYSKQYLYNFFQIIFIRKRSLTFKDRFRIFTSLITKTEERFLVIYRILGGAFRHSELNKIDDTYQKISKSFRNSHQKRLSQQVNAFLDKNKESNLIGLRVEARDYVKAIEKSLDKLSKDIDIYHLGFNQHVFKIGDQCAVIGERDLSKSATFPSNFQIDGYTRSNSEVFNKLLDKIQKIQNNNIDKESYNKILSAVRYYRTAGESPEVETKLLNYWIGLEYIFTAFNSEEKTIDRIRRYFPKCHALIYVKRNMFDFHKALGRQGLSGVINNYSDDLNYLLSINSYRDICAQTNSELLKFRTQFFQKWYEEPNKIEESLKHHQDNLIWNFTRLYRIRNEIVHNAAIKNGIYVHISHIKYYLTFILNSVLDYMAEMGVDTDNDGKITIEDFFIAQEIILGSLKGKKLAEFLNVKNPTQILN
ncbi:hypothetical protein HHL17_06150 [Chitinophaga sp. G-6-1-13]|uniref:Apea-like HEPN domain-containing protein n=1 Tax=Chitinophaga fulva TaxID=2728842 RepID=A0A848GDN3_9BACT|nr:hypothetical protein [Chitinophaga fulva]NML36775.1 hypothetical protein [Chitinophaga fulva]